MPDQQKSNTTMILEIPDFTRMIGEGGFAKDITRFPQLTRQQPVT